MLRAALGEGGRRVTVSRALVPLPPAREACGPPCLDVALGQPLARLDQLDDVDDLLAGHDGEADAGQDPGPEGIHLVGAGHLERGGTVRVRKDLAEDRRVDLRAGTQAGIRRNRLEQRGLQDGRREGQQVEGNKEQLVEGAEDKQHRLVGVVEVEEPAPRPVDGLVARGGAAHGEGGIDVDVVAGEVERDKALEDDGPAGEGGGQEDEQAGGRAAVGHHVEHRAEARGLLKVARGIAVEGVEEARDAVEDRAGARVQRHVVERGDGQDDARVAWTDAPAVSSSPLVREETRTGRGKGRDKPITLGQKRKMFSRGYESSPGFSTTAAWPLPLLLPLLLLLPLGVAAALSFSADACLRERTPFMMECVSARALRSVNGWLPRDGQASVVGVVKVREETRVVCVVRWVCRLPLVAWG